jgi:subtilisin family serine protease
MIVHCRPEQLDPAAPLVLVGLSRLIKLAFGAASVKIGLIDGAVTLDHPDLAKDDIYLLPPRADAACDSKDFACTHGTMVAGVLHARRGTSAPAICPGCTLVVRPIFSNTRVSKESVNVPNTTPQEVAAAILEAISADVRIVNLSIGLAESSMRSVRSLREMLDYAAEQNVIVVAASGNQGEVASSAITRHPWVIPVVAVDDGGRVLPFSNIGTSVGRRGLGAPGYNIISLDASGGVSVFTGTSVAVPFVSGTLALLWSIFPEVDATELRLAVLGEPTRRRSITPPLLDAWTAFRTLEAITARHVR